MKGLNISSWKIFRSDTVKNSVWGIAANGFQVIFVSLFFVIMARQYASDDFAHFLIASTVYQILVAFSSMGLGMWFIREFDLEIDKVGFTSKFIVIQTGLGFLFYLINIGIAFILYPEGQIRWLCVVLGSNIIFDNIIYVVKNLNIAEFNQKKTFTVLVLDGFLRLMLGCVLFIYPFSIITLSILLIILRFLTVNLFIKVGSSNNLSLKNVWFAQVVWEDVKTQIISNWQFVVIGSISIIYWRIANIIIAKTLTLQDVADYEVAFRVFSLFMILPTIAVATVYSQFVKYCNAANGEIQKQFYKRMFVLYSCYSVICYAFIYSFADTLLLYAFGDQYVGAITCLKEMFLTMLVFPTVLLQANLIVAMKHEKIDMWLNILSFLTYLAGCFIGLSFSQSLTAINYSIFASFVFFHIFQNIFLVKKNIASFTNAFFYYMLLLVFVVGYHYLTDQYNAYLVFVLICGIIFVSLIVMVYRYQKNNTYATGAPLKPLRS